MPNVRGAFLGVVLGSMMAMAAAADTGMPATDVVKQADAAWAHRDEGPALQTALQLYERAVPGAAPSQQRALFERLASGTYLFADNYLPENSKDQQKGYRRAALWGEACLRLDPRYAKTAKQDLSKAVAGLDKAYVGCLFFKAAGMGRDAQITGIMKSLSRKPTVDALMKRAYKLDPNYLDGAPDRYYGVYYSVLPGFLGGSRSKSEEHFKHSLEVAPQFLGTKVLMAKNLYDKGSPEYKQLLTEVVNADPNAAPARYAAENRIEQRKARRLLAQAGVG